MTQLITLHNIRKEFGEKVALAELSINLHEGEILGFLGPSGAGKTTTIKIITGQLHQTSGEAEVLGKDSRKIDESIYRQIGIVTDNSGVYDEFSVYDNLALFASILQVDKSTIDGLLARVGLSAEKKQAAGKLSKGQKQRLVLVRAILHNPRILFLDEPTSGLDPSTAKDIHDLLLELKSEGTSIFLTTHNMEEATRLCDRVALLNEGRVVEEGAPLDICLRYNTEKKYELLLSDKSTLVLSHNKHDLQALSDLLNSDQVETLHSLEPSLESVFLKVTGRGLQ
ncbi:MAG: ABC transporter ATP-binding protein [Erysipelotrichaceae bacterium]|jgi:ABC-2 type transport system ATP-binding protein|nr:ABC transporter ATP-binding protein [Erysipelotrichaceae bacterium]